MLAAPPFSASCGNVLQAACRTSYSASFGQEVAAAMLTALPLYTSCGNALRAAAAHPHHHPPGRKSQPRCWLDHLLCHLCTVLQAAAAPHTLNPSGKRSRPRCWLHYIPPPAVCSKSSPSRCVSPAVAFTSKILSQRLAETRRSTPPMS